jgi:hypothetical protein
MGSASPWASRHHFTVAELLQSSTHILIVFSQGNRYMLWRRENIPPFAVTALVRNPGAIFLQALQSGLPPNLPQATKATQAVHPTLLIS